jgi:hypothetical protein
MRSRQQAGAAGNNKQRYRDEPSCYAKTTVSSANENRVRPQTANQQANRTRRLRFHQRLSFDALVIDGLATLYPSARLERFRDTVQAS